MGGVVRIIACRSSKGANKMKKVPFIGGFIVVLLCCLAPAVFSADGFGRYTTGGTGTGGTVVTVDSDAELFKSYVETPDVPYIIQVRGTVDLGPLEDGDVSIRSNKTIRGIGDNPTIIGSLGFKNGCSNVIIERLKITCPENQAEEEDGISVKEDITNVFITKCTFYDCWDGCIDIARRSDWVTVSWCKFYFTFRNNNNDRVSLVGNTDSSGDEGTLHVTFHHNWFSDMCMQRMPSLRYGRGHIYNNYYNCPGNIYCVRSRIQAECLIENNYFDSVKDPYYIYIKNEPPEEYGKIAASGNVLVSCTGQVDDGDDIVFTPPYVYTLDDTLDVPEIVQLGAGADGLDFFAHWLFGLYGDFDRNDIVDTNDLSQFVQYWLDTKDITDINDADYNGDGIVNGYEYALFAGNWLQSPPDLTPPAVPGNLWASAGDSMVSLEWDDNNEPDLDGYNLYRSTTSGGGYAKLNDSPLIDSDYTDNSVANGTMYYYVVTAVDTSENESNNSVEACAVPSTDGNSITIQEYATGFCGLDGGVETEEHPGYTGYGYANTENASGNGIDWSINIASAGSYTFKWRYANGSSDRPARLLINGSPEVSGISFPGTGAWENWSEVSVGVTLSTGIKDIRLEATGSSGLANIDYLIVTGPEPQIEGCP